MADIGGNITGTFQTKTSTTKNEIGERINTWTDAVSWDGFLDMQSGDSKRSIYNAKIEESTNVFICDFNEDVYALKGQDVQMVIKGDVYDVLFIDNPMELDEQLEVYLKKIGGQNV